MENPKLQIKQQKHTEIVRGLPEWKGGIHNPVVSEHLRYFFRLGPRQPLRQRSKVATVVGLYGRGERRQADSPQRLQYPMLRDAMVLHRIRQDNQASRQRSFVLDIY